MYVSQFEKEMKSETLCWNQVRKSLASDHILVSKFQRMIQKPCGLNIPGNRGACWATDMDGVSNDSVAKVVECDAVILSHQARVPEDKSETL
jgi:hypothetical protein